MSDVIYLDHAATTPLHPEVLDAMLPTLREEYGNASTLYGLGASAHDRVERARAAVARLIGARAAEVYFTSGATESNNWAIVGTAQAQESRGRHLITSAVEHPSVLKAFEFLASRGFEVTVLPVDRYGRVDPDDVQRSLTDRTTLVSVMAANNEVGTIQPIAEIGALCSERGVLFHTDAVQAVGKLPIDVAGIRCDLLSLSAHKIYGPKGVGALYIRKGVRTLPLLHGGEQESGRRSGTHNVPGIVGLGRAAEIAARDMDHESLRLASLRDRMIERLLAIPDTRLSGHPVERLPNNAHVCIAGVEGESVILDLDSQGICISSGSACSSGSVDPSHVLLAMGLPLVQARGALRFTLGRSNAPEQIELAGGLLQQSVERLRDLNAWSGAAK